MHTTSWKTFAVVVCLMMTAPVSAVVIHEIHYHPPEGALLEFVELYNPRSEALSLAGWHFAEGIDYRFPPDATLEPNGFLLVCKDPERIAEHFNLSDTNRLFGSFGGGLSNTGERVTLLDDNFRVIDTVRYNDSVPWPAAADGDGPSLQLLCAHFEPLPSNWRGNPGALPTPLQPTPTPVCPPPTPTAARVTFHEIHYHPLDDDGREEFIELRNNSGASIHLAGYSIPGISYTFEDVTLPADGLLAVARDPEHLAKKFTVGEVVGGFAGSLSNGGENLVLLDAAGDVVDSVRYRDHGLWPAGPDGTGLSLEKISSTAPSEDPAAWRTASFADISQWTTVRIEGRATGSQFLFYLSDRGELLIDNFRVIAADTSAELYDQGYNLNADDLWTAKGNHAKSTWLESGGPDGSGALHLISEGAGNSANALILSIAPELPKDTQVIVSFQWRHLNGTTDLITRLTGSSFRGGVYERYADGSLASPGLPNTVEAERVPAVVSHLRRVPQEPRSTNTVWISAAVHDRTAPTEAVFLEYRSNDDDAIRVAMLDDGKSGDGSAGDGFLGAPIPPQPHNTVVRFRVVVQDDAGAETTSPLPSDPTGSHAFYVNDFVPETDLPVYTLLVEHASGANPQDLAADLNCDGYRDASFAYRGDVYYGLGLRARGESVCGSRKRYLKVRFNRGNFFRDVRKINLQSMWTDKSLVREYLTWNTVRDLGALHSTIQHVRIHMNGEYFGLYAELEHPDERYLKRNGRDPNGNLYKAINSTEQKQSHYVGSYEKETNEDGDFSDLADFIDSMHATPTEDLVAFFSTRVDGDAMIRYFAAHTTASNNDFVHKNHFLYHDPGSDRWFPAHWDVDQSYGKGGVWNDLPYTPGGDAWSGIEFNSLLFKFFRESGDWYRRAYLVTLWNALHEIRPLSFYEDEIAFLRASLSGEAAEDFQAWGRTEATSNAPDAPAEFEPNLDLVRTHVHNRQKFLVDFLRDNEKFTGHDRLKITEIMYNPPAGVELEFLELWNVMGTAVDVTGWTIPGIEYTFPVGTRLEPDEVVVVAKDPATFAARYGTKNYRLLGPYAGTLSDNGEELRLKDAGPDYPATVDTVRYDDAGEWPPRADGLGPSLELRAAEPDLDNDQPVSWSASVAGGTPGVLPTRSTTSTRFRRGDLLADGRYNLVDAVTLLRYLTGAPGTPPCLAALDVDANGSTNITDAVFLLNFVFLRNSPAPPPPGPGECAPAPDDSCQVSNCAS